MQRWQVWVAWSHLFPFPILNLRLTAAIKHPSCSPADGNDSTVGENDLLMAAGLPPFRAGGSRRRLETPLPRRGVSTPQRIGKPLIGGSVSAPQSCSPFRKPGKSDLLFHHQGGEEREKKKRREKQRRDREAVQGMGQGAGCPAGSRQSMSAAQTEKQRGSSHVPVENQRGRSRCAKGQIPHPNDKSQEVAKPPLQEPPRYRDEAAGKDDEVQSDGDPHTPQLICAEKLIPKPSLPSTLLYFRLFGGGYSPSLFLSSLGLSSLL